MGKTTYSGLPTELPTFLRDLAKNNDKAWFDAHRELYERCYLDAAKELVLALAPELAKLSPALRAEPRVNGSIMRINRDTRFGKDKRPYKDGLHLMFPEGDGPARTRAGLYLRVTGESVGFAAGIMGFDPKQLARYREAVADDATGRPLTRALATAAKEGFTLNEPHYKRVPKGYEADHPRAELLRHAGFFVGGDVPASKAIFGAKAVPWVMARFRSLRPAQRWLAEHVA